MLKEAAAQGHHVLFTTDHGSILCQRPTTVFARRDATANLRYKYGGDLRAEDPGSVFATNDQKDLGFPAGKLGTTYLLAMEDFFFVYPTKLREYQARYRNSFLHGGISPEEMIVPVAHPHSAGPTMKIYLRILGYLKAHGWVFATAVFATFIFAGLDAFSFLLVIPFLRVLFSESDGAGAGGCTGDHQCRGRHPGPDPERDRWAGSSIWRLLPRKPSGGSSSLSWPSSP